MRVEWTPRHPCEWPEGCNDHRGGKHCARLQYEDRIRDLEAQLATARDAALEEAARIAEDAQSDVDFTNRTRTSTFLDSCDGDLVADRIRMLKSKVAGSSDACECGYPRRMVPHYEMHRAIDDAEELRAKLERLLRIERIAGFCLNSIVFSSSDAASKKMALEAFEKCWGEPPKEATR